MVNEYLNLIVVPVFQILILKPSCISYHLHLRPHDTHPPSLSSTHALSIVCCWKSARDNSLQTRRGRPRRRHSSKLGFSRLSLLGIRIGTAGHKMRCCRKTRRCSRRPASRNNRRIDLPTRDRRVRRKDGPVQIPRVEQGAPEWCIDIHNDIPPR